MPAHLARTKAAIRRLLAHRAELDRQLVERRADRVGEDAFEAWAADMPPRTRILASSLRARAALDNINAWDEPAEGDAGEGETWWERIEDRLDRLEDALERIERRLEDD